jgi:hypothetical protein
MLLPGFDNVELYKQQASKFVGSQEIISLSKIDEVNSSSGLTSREALCNCQCSGEANFVSCINTARTTDGVSIFSLDPFSSRWQTTALRIFGASSENSNGSRKNTNFFEHGELPDGPGGQIFFEVAYLQDTEPRIVRGYTGPVSCASRDLCEQQCAGKSQFESWSMRCNATKSSSIDNEAMEGGLVAGIAVVGVLIVALLVSYFRRKQLVQGAVQGGAPQQPRAGTVWRS